MEANNMKAMREALEKLMDNLKIHAMMPGQHITMNHAEVDAMIEDCRSALDAPPRNCEVGTSEEQAQRFRAVCESVKPANPHYSETGELLCPSIGSGQECKLGICNFGQCALKWAQMPYEEGGAG